MHKIQKSRQNSLILTHIQVFKKFVKVCLYSCYPVSSFHFDEKFVKICVQNSCHFDYFLIRESLFTFLVKNSAYLVLVVLAHHFGLSPLPNRHI